MNFENNNEQKISKDSKIFLELREIVNKFDPVSLVKNGAPDNEHDRLTTEILLLLFEGERNKIRDLLIDCDRWYGFDPNDIKEEYKESFNKKIDQTYKEILDWYSKSKS